jgi:hypothetical protein
LAQLVTVPAGVTRIVMRCPAESATVPVDTVTRPPRELPSSVIVSDVAVTTSLESTVHSVYVNEFAPLPVPAALMSMSSDVALHAFGTRMHCGFAFVALSLRPGNM